MLVLNCSLYLMHHSATVFGSSCVYLSNMYQKLWQKKTWHRLRRERLLGIVVHMANRSCKKNIIPESTLPWMDSTDDRKVLRNPSIDRHLLLSTWGKISDPFYGFSGHAVPSQADNWKIMWDRIKSIAHISIYIWNFSPFVC